MFEAWGHHVVSQILAGVTEVAPLAADLFIRIPPKPRLKTNASILEKAFRRGKPYSNPYDDITDKVGARFVVLLGRDIQLLCNVVEQSPDWTCSRDRDYSREQEERPIQFEYAAVHYIVRCRSEMQIGEHIILVNAPCEIQIKTILQHAYSELTHDTIYKPSVIASPDMRRAAAKSMALLEATGDYFEKVVTLVEAATQPAKGLSSELSIIYKQTVKRGSEVTRAEGLILEAYEDVLGVDPLGRIRAFLAERPYIGERIANRAPASLLYRQPSILLIYNMAHEVPSIAKDKWPFLPEELRPVFTDLGVSFNAL